MTDSPSGNSDINLAWSRSDRSVPRLLLRPLQQFLETSESGAVLLLLATLAALFWANSPWSASYDSLWHTPVTLRFGSFSFDEDLAHVINDGLMSLFFLVVGLEIKRELLTGELRRPRAAAIPVLAALGGMVVPALIFFSVNVGHPSAKGWGIPMATDIAFALGVLTIAARRGPRILKPFLLTLAIVDDIGAIVVIAIFYSSGINTAALGLAAAMIVLVIALTRMNVRHHLIYVLLGLGIWAAVYASGVHATIAGVIVGLLTPAVAFQRPATVSDEARRVADETDDDPNPPDADAAEWLRLAALSREAVSPLARVEHALLPWTSFLVLPLFALANAGVPLGLSALTRAASSRVAIGIVLGLVVGKTVGVAITSALTVKMRIGHRPRDLSSRYFVGIGATAGVGFTVALFIAELAFGSNPAVLADAKIGILAGSAISAGLAMLALRSARPAAENI